MSWRPYMRGGPSVRSSSYERFVIDASAAVELLLGGFRARAVRQIVGGGATLAAPDLLNAEVLSAFRRFEAAGAVEVNRAAQAIERLADAPIERLTTTDLAREVWGLRHNLSPYDATYVALAAALECPLLTADEGIARAPRTMVPVVKV